MIFEPTAIPDVVAIRVERHADERGTFARLFCEREFAAAGLPARFVQRSSSISLRRHTLRGMHWQAAPYAEGKLVRCCRGAIYDVVVDLRPDSAGFRRWLAFELTAHGDLSLYIPEGCAHGFLTLEDDTEVDYAMTRNFAPDAARGFRYDDPAFGIAWPAAPSVIGQRDRDWPPFDTCRLSGLP